MIYFSQEMKLFTGFPKLQQAREKVGEQRQLGVGEGGRAAAGEPRGATPSAA